jgi:hypothetical protein
VVVYKPGCIGTAIVSSQFLVLQGTKRIPVRGWAGVGVRGFQRRGSASVRTKGWLVTQLCEARDVGWGGGKKEGSPKKLGDRCSIDGRRSYKERD